MIALLLVLLTGCTDSVPTGVCDATCATDDGSAEACKEALESCETTADSGYAACEEEATALCD